MNHWILILIIQGVSAYGQFPVTSMAPEFYDLSACQDARAKVLSDVDGLNIKAYCVEK